MDGIAADEARVAEICRRLAPPSWAPALRTIAPAATPGLRALARGERYVGC